MANDSLHEWINSTSKFKPKSKTRADKLFYANIGLVPTVAAKLCHEPTEEDLQMGMIGLMKAAQKFLPHRGTRFSTYAWACIRNQIRSRFRTRITPERVEMRREPSVEGDHDAYDDHDELRHSIGKMSDAIRQLPDQEADVVLMRHVENMTLAQVARRMGITKEWVRQIEMRAMAKLREMVAGDCA